MWKTGGTHVARVIFRRIRRSEMVALIRRRLLSMRSAPLVRDALSASVESPAVGDWFNEGGR